MGLDTFVYCVQPGATRCYDCKVMRRPVGGERVEEVVVIARVTVVMFVVTLQVAQLQPASLQESVAVAQSVLAKRTQAVAIVSLTSVCSAESHRAAFGLVCLSNGWLNSEDGM